MSKARRHPPEPLDDAIDGACHAASKKVNAALVQAVSESETREFITGARRDADNGKPRLDYLPWRALRSLGAYMRESADRFGACNYRRGMPLSELNASMLRHAADYQTAHSQDEAVRALHGVLFNASVALEQIILGRDDLDDMDVIRDGARPDAEFIGTPHVAAWPDDEADVHSVRVPMQVDAIFDHTTGNYSPRIDATKSTKKERRG